MGQHDPFAQEVWQEVLQQASDLDCAVKPNGILV